MTQPERTSPSLRRACRGARHGAPRSAACGALAAAALAGALAGAPAPAAAQTSKDRVAANNGAGMDMHLFRPAVDSKGFFTVNGADILGANDISLGLVLDYGHGMLDLNDGHGADGGTPKYMLDHAFQGTLQFDYGLANFLVLGVSLPLVLNGGEKLTDIGAGPGQNYDTEEGLAAQALGNVSLHAKLRVLRPDGPLGLSLLAEAGYGVANARNFAADPGFFYWPQAILERRFGSVVRLALNGGFRGVMGDKTKFGYAKDGKTYQLRAGNFEYGNLVTGGFGASVRVLPVLDLTAETYMTFQLGGASDTKQRLSAEAIGGIKLFVERNSYFLIGGGFGYTDGFQAAAQRATIGFVFEPSIGDRDGDGIKDDEDDCPDEAEDFDGFQDTRSDSPPHKYGCPDPDNDDDGIPDTDDRCPNDPEDKDGKEDEDGCPEAEAGDRDGDGILDSRDKCPDDPEDRDGFEDQDGCPDPDNDKDGIPDKKDQCPNDPEDKDGFQDEDGCPDPDNDGDGIPDAKDKCPDEPETFNGLDDEDGCPDKGKVIIEGNNVIILEKIQFKTGSAEILKESYEIVDAVATTLSHHPEFTMVEVQGHADERDDDQRNLTLTQARAKAVVDALIKKGVDRNKVRAMGYGEYCPLDPAHNKNAWEKNRRVEFKVVTTESGSTGVDLGCEAARAKGVTPPQP